MALWSVLLPLSPECQDYRRVPACLVYGGLGMEPSALCMLGKHSPN